MALEAPQCWIRKCKHYQGIKHIGHQSEVEIGEVYTCNAFPRGIPYEIALGMNKHLKVHPKQKNQIVYEYGER
jgi:hypothetical protein